MNKKLILITFFSILLSSCNNNSEIEFKYANELSYGTKRTVNRLINYGEITGSAVGYAAKKPKQWDNFIEFRKIVTEKELQLLIKHPHPVIKCYSFDLLVKNKHKDIFEILKSSLTDSSTVYTQYGCIGSRTQVNDYFIRSILRPSPKDKFISDNQKIILDSLILFKPNISSEYKNGLLENTEPKKENYDRIRNLALNDNKSAIIGLAKFRNKNDYILINDLLQNESSYTQEFGLKAVKNYPDMEFWNSIKNIHFKQIKKSGSFNYSMIKELYQALVQYKNTESRELLELTLSEATESAKKYHSEYIWVALKKYPDEIYDGILEQINFDDYEIGNLEMEWDIEN